MDRNEPKSIRLLLLALLALLVLAAGIWWQLAPSDTRIDAVMRDAPSPVSVNTGPAPDRQDLMRTPAEADGMTDRDRPAADETRVLVRVVDHDGTPLVGVGVRVARPGPWGTWKDMRTGITGPAGDTAFSGYARDDVWAEVDADTLPAGHVAAVRVHGSLKQSDAATLVLECPRACTLRGRLMRAFGEPIATATIVLHPLDHDGSGHQLRTAADGRFELIEAHPGQWRIAVDVRDRRKFAGASLPPPVTCRIAPGDVGGADLRCRPQGYWLLGRVVDQHDRPVPGVLVGAATATANVDGRNVPEFALAGRAFAITDGLGGYRLGPLDAEPVAVQVGDRHGSDGVTRDDALFEQWPEGFLATPGDGVEHVTTVDVVDDVIAWRIRPRLDARFANRSGLGHGDLRAKVGWCRLFLDGDGAWTVLTKRRGKDRLFTVACGQHEWRVELPEPHGGIADVELELPRR